MGADVATIEEAAHPEQVVETSPEGLAPIAEAAADENPPPA
jgi:hypothetical protein